MSKSSGRWALAGLLLLAISSAGWAQPAFPNLRLLARGENINPGAIFVFSDVAVGAQGSPVTFTFANLGAADLALGSEAVTVRGEAASMFVVVAQPSRLLPAGGSVTFRMVFLPRDLGPHMARVTIDAAGRPNLYRFLVAGNGAEP